MNPKMSGCLQVAGYHKKPLSLNVRKWAQLKPQSQHHKKMFPVFLGGSEPTDVFNFLDSVVYIS